MTDTNIVGVALVKELCPMCAKEIEGPIILNTVLTPARAKEVESLHGQVIGFAEQPCDECKELKTKGFVLIGVVEAKTDDIRNPYRSGNIWVITHEASKTMFPPDKLVKGVAYIDVLAAELIGLPNSKLDA